jgi:hypothetical protein
MPKRTRTPKRPRPTPSADSEHVIEPVSQTARVEPIARLVKTAYFNRELSWLAFNRRVLEQAQNSRQPLLERVKFLAIVSSNLDEFFEIRVAGLIQQVESGVTENSVDGLPPREQLRRIHSVVGSSGRGPVPVLARAAAARPRGRADRVPHTPHAHGGGAVVGSHLLSGAGFPGADAARARPVASLSPARQQDAQRGGVARPSGDRGGRSHGRDSSGAADPAPAGAARSGEHLGPRALSS